MTWDRPFVRYIDVESRHRNLKWSGVRGSRLFSDSRMTGSKGQTGVVKGKPDTRAAATMLILAHWYIMEGSDDENHRYFEDSNFRLDSFLFCTKS